jgi:hypothetical protein
MPDVIGRCAHCDALLYAHAPVQLVNGRASGERHFAHVACEIKAQGLNEGWNVALAHARDRGTAIVGLLAGARDACGPRYRAA